MDMRSRWYAGRGALDAGGGAPVNPVQTNLALWCKYGVGITQSGGLVSQWDDASGGARHLKQATATNQPALNGSAILFDGADNFLKCDAFTLNQPVTIYLLAKLVSWVSGRYIFDGNTNNTGVLYQSPATPNLSLYAGVSPLSSRDLTVGSYGVVTVVFNGASCLLQVNNGSELTGNAGSSNTGGFALGCSGMGDNWSNIEVKEAIIYSVAHDATNRGLVNGYLAAVGGI